MATHSDQQTPQPKLRQVASWWHTLGLLMLLLAISLCFFRMQSQSPETGKTGGGHQGNATLYLAIIASEWALVFYVWLGGRRKGTVPLRELIGGRWGSLKAVMLDIAVAAAFWIVWTLVAMATNFMVGPSHAESLGFLNPRGVAEVTLWVIMSVTAGFCEEVVYRGYLQRQVLALTGSAALAVSIQAVLFGVGHWYQGNEKVIVITVLGALFGVLAHWRKSLRPGMISHAWSDMLNVIPIRFP